MIYLVKQLYQAIMDIFMVAGIYFKSMSRGKLQLAIFDFVLTLFLVIFFTVIIDNPNALMYTSLIGMLIYINIGFSIMYFIMIKKDNDSDSMSISEYATLRDESYDKPKNGQIMEKCNTKIQEKSRLQFGLYKTLFAVAMLMYIYLMIDNAFIVTVFINYQLYLMFKHLIVFMNSNKK